MLTALLAATLVAVPPPAPALQVASEKIGGSTTLVGGEEGPRLWAAIKGLRGMAGAETAAGLAAQALAGASAKGLERAISAASAKVFSEATRTPALKGMGATLVAAAQEGGRLTIAHVGDCRAWRLRGGKLEQLTEDHSLLNDYLKTRKLTPEEIAAFPYKNVVVRAVGVKSEVQADVRQEQLAPGDRYLLATAELQSALDPERIGKLLGEAEPAKALAAAAQKLGVTELALLVLTVPEAKK
ncbi:MAG: protein phosphatase 2C domain-containing protein [Myxococcales bacterium]